MQRTPQIDTAPQCLTVLAPLRPGADVRLRPLLRAIGDDINGKRPTADTSRMHVNFAHSRAVHFARIAILDDPDRGAGRQRLLYATVYDGDLDSHLQELMAITPDMDAICCGALRARCHCPGMARARLRVAVLAMCIGM